MKQEPGETVDNFCTRLRLLAANCDFTNKDRELKSQILQGCTSTHLRRRGLHDDMDLDTLLNIARSLEMSDAQATVMEEEEAVNAVYRRQAQHGERKGNMRGFRSQNQQQTQQQQQHNCSPAPGSNQHGRTTSFRPNCSWCGSQPHSRVNCPARDKQCRSCSKMGHYATQGMPF